MQRQASRGPSTPLTAEYSAALLFLSFSRIGGPRHFLLSSNRETTLTSRDIAVGPARTRGSGAGPAIVKPASDTALGIYVDPFYIPETEGMLMVLVQNRSVIHAKAVVNRES